MLSFPRFHNYERGKSPILALIDSMATKDIQKKSTDIEELLGLNIRADRLVVRAIDTKGEAKECIPVNVEWSAYAKKEESEECILDEKQLEMIQKVVRNEEQISSAVVDTMVTVFSHTKTCSDFFSILALLESYFHYDNMTTYKLLSSGSLCKISEKLASCMQRIIPGERCCDECEKEENRHLIIRMAGFISGLSRVCDEDVVSDETAAAHTLLRTRMLEFEYQFFSQVNPSTLNELECVFMMEVLTLYLRNKTNRKDSLEKGLLKILSQLFDLCVSNAVQFVYLLLFCIWNYSFLPEALPHFKKSDYNIVGELANSLNIYTSEKIIRMIVSIVQNLIKCPNLTEELIASNAIRKLNLLNQRIFKDKDISELLKSVLNVLNANYDILTSFDLYVKEIESSILRSGPRHTDDFWKENVRAFEFEDFKYIKMLIDLIDSKDSETVRVACFDLGAFACYYPNGRKIVAQFHGKEKVMSLLASEDATIVEAALSACSRLMIENWESVGN